MLELECVQEAHKSRESVRRGDYIFYDGEGNVWILGMELTSCHHLESSGGC
jgi:hypothetical protein